MTFGEYLDANYSADFADRYAVPVLCVVCTCSPAAVRAYPADTLVEYWLCWALRGEGLRRADGGTKEVVERLSASDGEPAFTFVPPASSTAFIDAYLENSGGTAHSVGGGA